MSRQAKQVAACVVLVAALVVLASRLPGAERHRLFGRVGTLVSIWAACVVVGPFLVGPFLLLARFRARVRPEESSLEDERARRPMSPVFESAVLRLESYGFERAGTLCLATDTVGTVFHCVCLTRPGGDDPVWVYQAGPRCWLGRGSRFEDGSRLLSSTDLGPDIIPLRASVEAHRFPGIVDPIALLKVHEALLRRRPERLVPPTKAWEEIRAQFLLDYSEALGFAVSRRVLADAGQNLLRFSFLGSFRAWRVLQPVRWLLRWRARGKARRLLRELGFAPSFGAQDPACRSAR